MDEFKAVEIAKQLEQVLCHLTHACLEGSRLKAISPSEIVAPLPVEFSRRGTRYPPLPKSFDRLRPFGWCHGRAFREQTEAFVSADVPDWSREKPRGFWDQAESSYLQSAVINIGAV